VDERELRQIREIVLGLPEVTERLSHGAPCFYVRGRRPVCYFHDHGFDNRDRVSLMCPAFAGLAEALVGSRPGRFYSPSASAAGVFGDWLGMFLDDSDGDAVDWEEVADVLKDAYRLTAPRVLVDLLDRS
jgi:hypothetical protein